MWNGDFSNAVDTSGNKITIYNPYSTDAKGNRMPFAGNIIPAEPAEPAGAQTASNSFARAGGPECGRQSVDRTRISRPIIRRQPNSNSITARGDLLFSSKDNLSIRFTKSKYNYLQAGGQYGYPPPRSDERDGYGRKDSNIYNITVHYTHAFTPTFLNDLQLAVQPLREYAGHRRRQHQLGLPNWALPNPFGATGWPTVYTDAYSMFYYGGWDSDNHKAQNMAHYEIDDNVTWVKGKHTLKFGCKGAAGAQQCCRAAAGAGVGILR